ncbi:MAG: hypothetical protein HOP36_13395 [Methyloglobulus sp.]|nr:hypothetical protein [Methyloglobulus sp.]
MDIYLPLTTKRSNMLLNLVSGIPLTHQLGFYRPFLCGIPHTIQLVPVASPAVLLRFPVGEIIGIAPCGFCGLVLAALVFNVDKVSVSESFGEKCGGTTGSH